MDAFVHANNAYNSRGKRYVHSCRPYFVHRLTELWTRRFARRPTRGFVVGRVVSSLARVLNAWFRRWPPSRRVFAHSLCIAAVAFKICLTVLLTDAILSDIAMNTRSSCSKRAVV